MSMRSILLLSAAIVVPQAAVAQDVFELDEAFVFSGLLPVEVNRTGSTVEVVEDEDLEGSEPGLENTLDRLPGVSVTSNGWLGTSSTIRVRGLDSKYVGVTFNGIEVTDPSSTQTSLNFGSFTRGLVGRLELAKGSQTTVYGSDAIAGAINIETWRPEVDGRSGEAFAEVGSFGTFSGGLSYGYRDEAGEVALTLTRTQTDGISARSAAAVADDDAFEETGLSVSVRRNLTDSVTVGVTGFLTDGFSEFDQSATDPVAQLDLTRTGVRAFAEVSGGDIEHEVGVSYFENDRNDLFSPFTNRFVGERLKLDYLGTVDLSATTSLAFGADWTEETSTLDGVVSDASNGAIFGELLHALGEATDLTLGLRHDLNSDFDDQTTARLAVAHRASETMTYRASVGSGFRAPSLYERFGPFAPATTLSPESSIGGEIGVDAAYENASYGATVFYTEIDDRIGFGTTTYVQAPGTTVAQGVELSADWAVGTADVFAAYTYTDAATEGTRLLRVPRHDLALGVSGNLSESLTAEVDVRAAYDTLDFGGPSDDFIVTNLTLTQALTDTTDAYLRVENIFDEDYETIPGFSMPGLSVFAGIRASF